MSHHYFRIGHCDGYVNFKINDIHCIGIDTILIGDDISNSYQVYFIHFRFRVTPKKLIQFR